ncbi:SRPBCC domain-containing protein [Nocardioides sp.]|uniref:SRPBCC domain-containing protein n=1 Tax=Nocardioides sp. TaxID=35761 RepID=UPI00286E5D50|nr:SRPBCC domain-containing protein [Nocardioides sp.]
MTTTQNPDTRYPEAAIEADPRVPAVHIWRDFAGTPEQLKRAHTDPELFRQWVGPDSLTTRIDHWDCRTLGSYRYVAERDGEEFAFRGTFPHIGDVKIVQTFTWEGMPEAIALETVTFEDLGEGRTRLHAFSLCDSFEARDGMLSSGMEIGIHEGYAKLDTLLSDAVIADDAR